MSLSEIKSLNSHYHEHGFDSSEHGFNTEVLTPDNSRQRLLTGESSHEQLPDKKRFLILANEGNKQSNKPKRSFKTM